MSAWITENAGTLTASIILIIIVGLVIFKLISDRRHGRSSCGCECGHCAMSGACHKSK